MKTEKLKKSDELKARLIKLGCFDEFCENLNGKNVISFNVFVDDKTREKYMFSVFILGSFTWLNTPQGHDFWNDICKKIDKI